MANYISSCRSNHFRVKDVEAFKAWVQTVPDVQAIDSGNNQFCLLGDNADGAGWPIFRWDETTDEEVDFEIYEEIVPHLAEGEVAIFMEVGAEKLRYLVGHAYAVAWTGEVVGVSLNDIYKLAGDTFVGCNPITVCEY